MRSCWLEAIPPLGNGLTPAGKCLDPRWVLAPRLLAPSLWLKQDKNEVEGEGEVISRVEVENV